MRLGDVELPCGAIQFIKGIMPCRVKRVKIVVGVVIMAAAYVVIARLALSLSATNITLTSSVFSIPCSNAAAVKAVN